jgi:hypothetical protein
MSQVFVVGPCADHGSLFPCTIQWSDKAWDSVMKCDQVKVFPYCVSDQASNGKGKDLKDVANIIHATQENGLNRAWGEDYVYLVPLPEATEENRDLDRISGATAPNAAIKLIYRYGYIAGKVHSHTERILADVSICSMKSSHSGSYYDDKWLANKVSCSSPYKWTMGTSRRNL